MRWYLGRLMAPRNEWPNFQSATAFMPEAAIRAILKAACALHMLISH